MKYSLGLDIGTTSIGWAVIDLENNRIHDVGVRIFDKPEDPQSGKSLAEPRRTARSARRRLKRRRQRLNTLKRFFIENKLLTESDVSNIFDSSKLNPYELREKGLTEKLTNEELFIALYHIAKRRGYHSNSKAQDDEIIKRIEAQKEKKKSANKTESSDDTLKVLSAVHDNNTLLAEYDSVAAVLNNSNKFNLHKRNKANNYQGSFGREAFKSEAQDILEKQHELGLEVDHEKIDALLFGGEELIREDGIIIAKDPGVFYQRPFMNATLLNGMRGKDLYNNKDRAPKASLTFETFRTAEDIAHIKNSKNPEWKISTEQTQAILEKVKATKTVKYSTIRELLGYKNNYQDFRFSYIKGKYPNTKNIKNYKELSPEERDIALEKEREKSTFAQMDFYHKVKNTIKEFPDEFAKIENSLHTLDSIGEILTTNKDDDSRYNKLKDIGLTKDIANSLLVLDFSKFSNLSIETMQQAIPLLLEGLTYDKALEKIYPGKFAAKLSGDASKLRSLNEEELQQITNPIVKRAISQTIKVVNAIIRKYGTPTQIGIEAAGDLSKNFKERGKIKKLQEDNAANNEKIIERLQNEFGVIAPSGLQITKFKLYIQQNGKCMYSGRPLSLNQLFADERYGEIDHIVPFSRCGNDSLTNKVLVLTEENQNKGNLTPFEAWGNNEEKWANFEALVNSTFLPYTKKNRLLAVTPPNEEWNQRALNDTRYISKFLRRYFRENLKSAKTEKSTGKQWVITPSGSITSYLRKRWQVGNKSREENNLHHATDACIIACVNQGTIQKISSLNKYYELFPKKGISENEVTDKLTGDIIHRGDLEQHIVDTLPWENFGKEVRIRTGNYNTPSEMRNELRGLTNYTDEFRDKIKPIFVSRMPKRKGNGPTNQETIRSPKIVENYENKRGEVTVARKQRVPLSTVRLKDLYDSPIRETDPKLYELLQKLLEDNEDDPKKAFAKPVYKPTKTGERGNVVRSIKVYDTLKSKTGFYINNNKAFVNNGTMIRLDVYQKTNAKGKIEHFFVPIYAHQLGLEKSGKKITKILPEPKGFTDIDDTFTKITSLFPNDYVRIYFNDKIQEGYYVMYGIAAGQMVVLPHQSANKSAALSISARSATEIQRIDVSVLGDNYNWI